MVDKPLNPARYSVTYLGDGVDLVSFTIFNFYC